jgi:hypothetical protein
MTPPQAVDAKRRVLKLDNFIVECDTMADQTRSECRPAVFI